jgi:hypothetical protein
VIGPSKPIEAVHVLAEPPEEAVVFELAELDDDELDDDELEPQPAANSASTASVAMMERPFT